MTLGTSTQSAVPSAAPLSPKRNWMTWLSKLGPLIGLAFVVGLFSILCPRTFPTSSNFQLMLIQTAVVGTAALGMTLIIISGGIDLSVGSNIALVTVVIALLLNLGWPPLLAAAAGVGAAMVNGLIIGSLVTGLRLAPFIVTLGLWGALRGAAEGLAGNTVLPCPDTWLNLLLQSLSPSQHWMLFPPGVWLWVVMSALIGAMLRYTRFGRHVFAIGSNEQTARLCGVAVNRTRILLYLVATFLAGLAGILQFSYLTVGDPTTANGLELNIIAAVVIGGASLNGGQGSALGSILGALMMTAVADGCTKCGMPNWVQEIVTGCIIIFAVSLDSLRHRRRS